MQVALALCTLAFFLLLGLLIHLRYRQACLEDRVAAVADRAADPELA